jgi:hypothetical protein
MSTKFNRNDPNAPDDQLFANDFIADLNGVEGDQRQALIDLHAMPCIISGLAVTVNSVDDTLFDVAAGVAYDNEGYRMEIPSAETSVSGADTTNNAINYICVRHKYSYNDGRAAYKTGVQYNSRRNDDWEIVVRTEAQGIQDDDVCLATSTGDGSAISVSTDNRTSPDFGGSADTTPPMTVTGVTLTTGPESSLIHSSVSSQIISDFFPVKSWIKIVWNQVTDPSGIKEYQVELVPLDNSNNELPGYLTTQKVAYAPAAPGGPQYGI